jgi:elongation factor P
MKIQANEIRVGNILENNGRRCIVMKTNTFKAGKGGAYIQVEMRDLKTGNKANERWRTSDHINKLEVMSKKCSFLFSDESSSTFMDSENFEQFSVENSALGESIKFLKENMSVTVDLIDNQAVAMHLPKTIAMKITETETVVKGQTATSSFKPAKLENGMKIMVPGHIDTGTRILVNTVDNTYSGKE